MSKVNREKITRVMRVMLSYSQAVASRLADLKQAVLDNDDVEANICLEDIKTDLQSLLKRIEYAETHSEGVSD